MESNEYDFTRNPVSVESVKGTDRRRQNRWVNGEDYRSPLFRRDFP
jgi:hypothetical protein